MWKQRLNQDHKQVSRELVNKEFSRISNIGLVAFIYDEKYLKSLEAYMHELQEKGKNVHIIGIVPDQQTPQYVIPKLSLDIIPRKMLNWYHIPQGKQVRDFQAKPFDLLIDLCFEHRKETLYITATSKASLKVGAYSKFAEPYYDFMLSTQKQEQETLTSFTSKAEEYLNQINPSGHEKQN